MNFNLYLDNLVDQGYDITLIKYYFELFYISGYENGINSEYENKHASGYFYGYGSENGLGCENGIEFGYSFGEGYDRGYDKDGYGRGFRDMFIDNYGINTF